MVGGVQKGKERCGRENRRAGFGVWRQVLIETTIQYVI